ncbi:MAG TPA: RluA family pseudouridine synthase [Candidatus Faecicola pullistercoris]|nr:RluA family pseudouridine synthase [Candidatus Faecicola pullistercoris]
MMKSAVSDTDCRLSVFVRNRYPLISYNLFNKLLRNRDVKVNGERVKSDLTIKKGDLVEVYCDITPVPVFENGNVFIVYKPKGVASDGVRGMEGEVRERYPDYFLCHRLDTNTDGLLVFAKGAKAAEIMYGAFKYKYVKKYYMARLYGRAQAAEYTDYLLKDGETGRVKVLSEPAKGAVKAVTAVRPVSYGEDETLAEISPLTGRTHQIRAQAAARGHFVLGDGKYGDDRVNKSKKIKNLCLTAYKLAFAFPAGHEYVELNAISVELSPEKIKLL